MNFIKLVCLFTVFFINVNVLNAEWQAEYLPLENEKTLEVLNNPALSTLKNRVYGYIKNSWCSQEKAKLLLELIVITKPKVCVEIGAFTGSSTLPILAGLRYLKQGNAYIIDAWSSKEAIRGLPSTDPNNIWWGSLNMKDIKNQFDRMINTWFFHPFCQTLQMTSKEAVSRIPEIDFLHLDGNFSEEGALLDSELYVPKVVPGGYILLSNALIMIGNKPAKMKALWPIFDQCDIVCEIEQGNTLLFRKKIKTQE